VQSFALKTLISGLLILLLTSSADLRSQDTAHVPFFAAGCFESDGYAEFQAVISQLGKSPAGFTGMGVYWVVNHRFVSGLSGFMLASSEGIDQYYPVNDTVSDPPSSRIWSAGLSFGYQFFHDKKFSLQPDLYAGWGWFRFTPYGGNELSRHFGVLWPRVNATWNAHKNFRLGLGIGYRAAVGQGIGAVKSTDLGGVTGQIFIRIGTF